MDINQQKQIAADWFRDLRNQIRDRLQELENEYSAKNGLTPAEFEVKNWNRDGGGGGEMSIIRGNLFERGGVNISTVFGEFSPEFRKQIPGADEDPRFFATGISLVIHPKSPMVPIVHMNTRFITTQKTWFGGGADLTPAIKFDEDKNLFHKYMQEACDKHDPSYYPKFSEECDKYFFLPHRNEVRGVGGIFYDYLNTGNFDEDFAFTQDVGKAFLSAYPQIVERTMPLAYNDNDKQQQLIKRGRYVEFNLLYDRGTKFGLMTGGNTEAILMSMPPVANWV
ncbi:MAG: oxygen-dependent coproporphyrinogen oxidase [Alphaproteobacteria bacterium]|nr:oxygen-dependent coproporphyrinogen oxidase [Alphaproteobacteria bacterium]OJV13523.1 MAG: coproporphyrinogen III oxidase [Alphaproteobacteria bacterium 33-17]